MTVSRAPLTISVCDFTGNMVRPWAEAGHECICVDIRQERTEDEVFEGGGRIRYVEADAFSWMPPREQVRIAFFAPECTNLAGSGARWFKGKGLKGLAKGIALVERCVELAEWFGCPWMLENPVGTLSTYWRKPDYVFHPWMYGDPEQKSTCLWTGNGFVMPQAASVVPPAEVRQSVWRMPPSEDRGRKRSVTPMGFSRAVFEANQ